RLDRELFELLVGEPGRLRAPVGDRPQGGLDGPESVARILLQRPGDRGELVGPGVGDPADRLLQDLAQSAASDGAVLLAGRPGADQVAGLFPDGAGPRAGLPPAV